jgi:mannose-6-phosphate isomerase-like protein (cupin superfamily)
VKVHGLCPRISDLRGLSLLKQIAWTRLQKFYVSALLMLLKHPFSIFVLTLHRPPLIVKRLMNSIYKSVRSDYKSSMKNFLVMCTIVVVVLVMRAQEAIPPGFEQWTASSLKPDLAKLAEEAPADPHHFAVRQLADYPNDSFLLVHRAGDGQVEWHETQADVFYVLSGSATLVVGGQLVNGETVGPHEKRNGQIIGGVHRKLSAGDIVRIPPRVPHQLLLDGAPEFNYFVVKVKGY